MNSFIRFTACARALSQGACGGARRFLSVCGAIGLLSLPAVPAAAQRVEFPTPVQPVQNTTPYAAPPAGSYVAPASPYPATTAAPPTYGATAPAVSPAYPAPPPTAAPGTVAPYPTTPYAAPAAVGPPPVFDPYASGSSVAPAAPPVAAPYGYTAPAVPYGAQPAPVPATAAPPYDITMNGESYWAKTQKLIQDISFEYTYLWGKGSDPFDFSINRVELSTTFAFPIFYNIETPLLVTPGFAWNWLQGPMTNPPPPVGPDMPPRTYDAYLDFAWYPQWYNWLGGELGFRTGVWTDFNNVNSDSVRFLGRGLATIAVSPVMDVRFGVVYIDRVKIKLLPAGGVYWRPTPDWDLYLVFPNPKARKFLAAIGNTKWYAYAAGEYGGDSWTVARETLNDQVDYNDIRVIGGLEWETPSLIHGHIEAGYVFDRELVFRSGDPPPFSLNDTIMLRAGVSY